MKKILFITYMFPPIAGGGIQRSLKFIKYLPTFGIEPIVVAPKKACWRAYDPENLALPFLKQTKTYRLGVQKLSRYYDLRFHRGYSKHPYFYLLAFRYIWFMDFFSAWYFECRKDILKIAAREKVSSVFTTSPPHSVHFFGHDLKKRLGIPWLMDLRDSMVDEPNRDLSKLSNQIQAKIEAHYERSFYRVSDAIISVSQPILDSLSRRHPSIDCQNKCHLIPNGFDEEDFEGIRCKAEKARPMTVTYTGAFLEKRTPKYFLDAVVSLVSKGQIDPGDILIRFAGYFEPDMIRLLASYAELLPVKNIGYQPYRKTLEYQVNSDVLLLIVGAESKNRGGQIYTGKFFEYLGAGKTIFALLPEGPLKDTIQSGRLGLVAPSKNVSQIAVQFLHLYRQWKTDKLQERAPDTRLKEQFSRKRLTGELAKIIKSAVTD